jgi:hypothetical protein
LKSKATTTLKLSVIATSQQRRTPVLPAAKYNRRPTEQKLGGANRNASKRMKKKITITIKKKTLTHPDLWLDPAQPTKKEPKDR